MMETTLDVSGHMPFLSPDQPWYSTEGLKCHAVLTILFRHAMATEEGPHKASEATRVVASCTWRLPFWQYSVRMHWFGASMQTPISRTMWSFARSRIYTNIAINSKALVRYRQACSGAGTRGGRRPPTFFDRGNASSTPPLFWTKIRAKGSPLLQLVSYLLKRSVR